MKTTEAIIERGRGPEIAGTRITVFDVLDYVLEGWHSTRIASFFHLSSGQIESAMKYIQQHKLDVITAYAKILERCASGNPPELRARLAKYQGKARQFLNRQRNATPGDGNGRNRGRQ